MYSIEVEYAYLCYRIEIVRNELNEEYERNGRYDNPRFDELCKKFTKISVRMNKLYNKINQQE